MSQNSSWGLAAGGSIGNGVIQGPSGNMAECNSPTQDRRNGLGPPGVFERVEACPSGRALRAAARKAPFGSTRRGVESGGEGACVSGCRDWQNVSHELGRAGVGPSWLASATRLPMANKLALRELPNILS